MVTARARLYGKSDRLREFQKTKSATPPTADGSYIYWNEFQYVFQGVTADNVIEALEEGAANIAEQISIDLLNTK